MNETNYRPLSAIAHNLEAINLLIDCAEASITLETIEYEYGLYSSEAREVRKKWSTLYKCTIELGLSCETISAFTIAYTMNKTVDAYTHFWVDDNNHINCTITE